MGQGPTLRTSFNLTTAPPCPETPSPNAVTLGIRASTHGLGGTQLSLLHRHYSLGTRLVAVGGSLGCNGDAETLVCHPLGPVGTTWNVWTLLSRRCQ